MCIAVMGLMNEPWEKVFRPYTSGSLSDDSRSICGILEYLYFIIRTVLKYMDFLHCFQSPFIMEEKAIQAKRYNMHFIFSILCI